MIFEAAGLSWTMSSEIAGYDSINYGLWYDDVQFARVAIKHAEAAKKLGVKKIVLGECGHAHKALTVIADRVLTGDLNIPRESCMVTLRGYRACGQDQGRSEPQRLPGHAARPVQPGPADGHRRAAAADPPADRARGSAR